MVEITTPIQTLLKKSEELRDGAYVAHTMRTIEAKNQIIAALVEGYRHMCTCIDTNECYPCKVIREANEIASEVNAK